MNGVVGFARISALMREEQLMTDTKKQKGGEREWQRNNQQPD